MIEDDPFADEMARFGPVDDGWVREPGPEPSGRGQAPLPIRATPFVWRDPRTIPLREWIYGFDLIRRFLTVTVAPGGVGKSSLIIVEALALATGRDLLGVKPHGRFRVWIWNGEDPLEELERRVTAAMLHYDIDPAEVDGWLFLDSGRNSDIVIARQDRNGAVIAVPVVDALLATIMANEIDVVMLDPFVSTHQIPENDNPAIDRVAKTFGRIADQTGCAMHLVHHVKKLGGAEASIEDSRGAIALIAAARVGRVLNAMTTIEAERFDVANPRLHFRVTNGKLNLAPPPEKSDWYRIQSVDLGNGHLGAYGDSIGVVTSWDLPNPLDAVSVEDLRKAQRAVAAGGKWRENVQANDWVGKPIAAALGLDLTKAADKNKVKGLIKIWIGTGMFVVVMGKDDKGNDRPYVEVGETC